MKHAFLKILVFCSIPLVSIFFINAKAQEGVWILTENFSNALTSIETTPWGIAVGEFGNWQSFNGIYISKDLGNTWKKSGLEKRGVTDIAYDTNTIYASTYYFEKGINGLFSSKNGGKDWVHLGNNFSALSVAAFENTIYLGTASHGLWVSNDSGQTWVQKIGDGYYGPGVTKISGTGNVAVAVIYNKTYLSTDRGISWKELENFRNKTVSDILIYKNLIYLGMAQNDGLYLSKDNGTGWEKLPSSEDRTHAVMTYFGNSIYSGGQLAGNTSFTVFESNDFGTTWKDTNLNIEIINTISMDIIWAYSQPAYLFILIPDKGIYRYEIPKTTASQNRFLDMPWETKDDRELTDKITSFFDHSYPLLGYSLANEPTPESTSTLNYLGMKEKIPYMYYSSHDGYDYDLNYGSEIKEPADGNAVYYLCKDCGNTIKIDHENGYQTAYMHLKKDGLISYSTAVPVKVRKGETIGYVGMTGNTTGPHLHFGVLRDLNNNKNFHDDYPQGKTDPYGWQSEKTADPWPLYKWEDALGSHQGSSSSILWNKYKEANSFLNSKINELALENIKLSFAADYLNLVFTTFLINYTKPSTPNSQKNLGYANLTSFLIESYDLLGNNITKPEFPLNLEISLKNIDSSNLILSTLKIYFWNSESSLWEALNSTYDFATEIISAQTAHLSHFAVLGEKIDSSPPYTIPTISGRLESGWYKEFPSVVLETIDRNPGNKIFYTFNGEGEWNEYSQAFAIERNGVNTLSFRSIDENGNVEETQNYILKINVGNLWTKDVKIIQVNFKTY